MVVRKKTATKAPAKEKPVKKAAEAKTAVEEKVIAEAPRKKQEYLYSVGRRKTSIAQVRLYKKGEGKITVNEKEFEKYFCTAEMRERILSPLKLVGQQDKLEVGVLVRGGGLMSQAEAVRHGISRVLLLLNQNFRKPLKKAGFLTRDARIKERKKPGLKRARKGPQWAKR